MSQNESPAQSGAGLQAYPKRTETERVQGPRPQATTLARARNGIGMLGIK